MLGVLNDISMLKIIAGIFIGSGLGGVLRYLTGLFITTENSSSGRWMLPYGTLIVNILGCLIFGLAYGLALNFNLPKEWKLALTTGLCGGLTTFSTFSFEILDMFSSGNYINGITYAFISLLAGVAFAWIGYTITSPA